MLESPRGIRSSHGTALAEALIASILLAICISAMLVGMFNTNLQIDKVRSHERAASHSNLLLQDLRNYVTASTRPVLGAPGNPPWHLPGDSCPGRSEDEAANCWALENGEHDASAMLPAWFRRVPYKATMTYRVKELAVGDQILRQVEASVNWEETGS